MALRIGWFGCCIIVNLYCLHPTISPYITGATSYAPGGDIDSGNNFYVNDGSCSVICPPPLYTDARIQAVWTFYRVFTVISWILLAVLIITYLKFRERRERQYLFSFLWCCFMACTSGLFTVFKGPFNQVHHSSHTLIRLTACVHSLPFAIDGVK
jgi:hypothetical protein